MTQDPPRVRTLGALLEHLRHSAACRPAPEEDTPLDRMTREFFENNWNASRDGLLARTGKIRVVPEPSPAPRCFRFEMATPYKRKHGDEPVELAPGPVRGEIRYHPHVLELNDPATPSIVVSLDPDLDYFHPNYSRRYGLVCLGDLPSGPFPLDALLEHLYSILSYANWRSFHPADLVAAHYFATDPSALDGVGDPAPLY